MRLKTLYKTMHEFSPKFCGEKTQNQYLYWVRKMLVNRGVKVTKMIDDTNSCLSGLTVGGFYDPSEKERDIEIYLVFRKEDKTVDYSEIEVRLMIDEIFKTYVHEKIHRSQYRKRDLDYGRQYRLRGDVGDEELSAELRYYGDPDELDAYAHESVLEARLYNMSHTLEKYKELFEGYDNKLYHKFLKKCYLYDKKIIL